MKRTHDADLCDRIRALEQRVVDLEHARETHVCGHWQGVVAPAYPYDTGDFPIDHYTSGGVSSVPITRITYQEN